MECGEARILLRPDKAVAFVKVKHFLTGTRGSYIVDAIFAAARPRLLPWLDVCCGGGKQHIGKEQSYHLFG